MKNRQKMIIVEANNYNDLRIKIQDEINDCYPCFEISDLQYVDTPNILMAAILFSPVSKKRIEEDRPFKLNAYLVKLFLSTFAKFFSDSANLQIKDMNKHIDDWIEKNEKNNWS